MSYVYYKNYDSPNYTPKSSVVRVFGVRRIINSITVHHWGDPKQSPTFYGIINWLCRKNGTSSAHAVIEAGRVACLVDYKDASWHAGNKLGNATSIGLELNPRCSSGDYSTAAEHIADIWMVYGKLPLIPHKHWRATECPGNYKLDRLKKEAEVWYERKKAKKLK